MPQAKNTDVKELADTLEPMIRRIIREELTNVLRKNAGIFHLTPEMPLYEDLEEITQRKGRDQIKLHSHEEVWRE